ncbi:glutaredoxin 3 [Limobrevibacterium gyesilva]|uniref:Glutaredoxin n=1 Tax=Limobrevibacterium gyesilva TaxID=2991712 RepID=A0AA41YJH6_9PROT|nr:glutaredoxin 3 [Limobrevibacterium gyesilva]MCW3472948.1 glutaredoxin 3 [Limobrevibacterium gyesilva]
MPDIEIYTQDWCPYCVRAKRLLDDKGVAYREIVAPGGTAEREEARARSGRSTVPQIFIDGQHIGGCDDLMALDRAGKLDPLLQAA